MSANLQDVVAELKELRRAIEKIRTPKALLSIEETAHYLGLAPKTIRNCLGPRAIKPFPVKPVRLGGRVLFKLADLQKFVNSLGKP